MNWISTNKTSIDADVIKIYFSFSIGYTVDTVLYWMAIKYYYNYITIEQVAIVIC